MAIDSKKAVKEAKAALDSKQYNNVLKILTPVLKVEKDNYMAWCIFGLASKHLNKLDFAENSYVKASNLDPKNPGAWKGLIELYESQIEDSKKVNSNNSNTSGKDDDSKDTNNNNTESDHEKPMSVEEKLGDAYKKLLALLDAKDPKFADYGTKALELMWAKGDKKGCLPLLLQLEDYFEKDPSKHLVHLGRLVDVLEEDEQTAIAKESQQQYEKESQKLKPKDKNKPSDNQPIDQTLLESLKARISAKHRTDLSAKLFQTYQKIVKFGKPPSSTIHRKHLERLAEAHNAKKTPELATQVQNAFLQLRKFYPTEWLGHQFTILQLDTLDGAKMFPETGVADKSLKAYFQELAFMFPERPLSRILLGILLYYEKKYQVSLTLISEGVKSCNFLVGWVFYFRALFKLTLFKQLLGEHQKALDAVEKRETDDCQKFDSLRTELLLLKANTEFRCLSFQKSIESFNLILAQNPKSVAALIGQVQAKAELSTPDFQEISEQLDLIIQLDATNAWPYFFRAKSLLRQGSDQLDWAIENIQKAISLEAENALYLHTLGVCYWKKGGAFASDKKYAQTQFLLSAKLKVDFADNFAYLGEFYRVQENDLEKAKRCYQKALSIDSLNEIAGAALVDIYILQGQKSLAISLLKQITNASPNVKWAWCRLAFHQQDVGELDESLVSFQRALKLDPDDIQLLNGVAESYKRLGKYIAALKAFNKVLEICPTDLYSKLQTAELEKELQSNTHMVITKYKEILQGNPDLVPAIHGLAEAYYSLAEMNKKARSYDSSKHALENCINYASRSKLNASQKTLGNAYAMMASIPHPTEKQIEFYEKSRDHFLQALKNTPQDANIVQAALHFDIGLSLYFQSSIDEKQKAKLLEESKTELEKAVQANPQHPDFWNALGMVEQDPRRKQHMFIQALRLQDTHQLAWSNLGVLYLQLAKYSEAALAFEKCLTISPSNSAWIGKAILADKLNTREGLEKAHVFFENAVRLSSLAAPEASLGLAFTSLHKGQFQLAEIELHNYIQLRDSPCGWNLYGLALENQGQFHQAEKAFTKANELINKALPKESPPLNSQAFPSLGDPQKNFSIFSGAALAPPAQLSCTLLNQARMATAQGKTVSAESLQAHANTWQSLLSLGLSCIQSKQLEQASQLLQKALLNVGTSSASGKQTILLMLAQTSFAKNDMNKAKEYITQCIKEFPQYLRGWLTMASMCSARGDLKASEATINTIRKRCPASLNSIDFYLVAIEVQIKLKNWKLALATAQTALRLFPQSLHVWNAYSLVLFNTDNPVPCESLRLVVPEWGSSLLTTHLAELHTAGSSTRQTNSAFNSEVFYSRRAKLQISSGLTAQAIASAYILLNSNPTNQNAWKILASALISRATAEPTEHNWRSAVSGLRNFLTISDPQDTSARFFASLALCESLLHLGDAEGSENVLQQLKPLNDSPEIKALIIRQKGRIGLVSSADIQPVLKAYQESLKIDPNQDTLFELGLIYFNQAQNYEAATLCWRQSLNTSTQQHHKLRAFVGLSQVNFAVGKFKDSLNFAKKATNLSPHSPTAYFLKALNQIKLNDLQGAEESLQIVLTENPQARFANYYLSVVHFQTNSLEEAESDLLYELDIQEDPLVYLQLSRVQVKAKEIEKAKESLTRAQELDPELKIVKDEIAKLK